MDGITISRLVGSSQYAAIADDALKDEDNAAWVMELAPAIRDEWIERIGWIRLIDRLAENELIDPGSAEFRKFYAGWKWLLLWGGVKPGCAYQEILNHIYERWFGSFADPLARLSVWSWNRYLKAIARYHGPDLTIGYLSEYEEMLKDLGGAFFQVLPFLQQHHWQAACHFGALDQFFNNLRDLQEDAQRGICYIPEELLTRFNVTRTEIIQQTASQNPGYAQMMQFLLDDYLPKLRQRAYPLIMANDLHPSWRILRDWSLRRYHRIERIFRDCHFDYTQFPMQYWSEVQQELPQLITQLQQQDAAKGSRYTHQEPTSVSGFATLPAIGLKLVKRLTQGLRHYTLSEQELS